MKIIFLGSDDFAVANLEALVLHSKHRILACVTQPDKRQGRHLELGTSIVKDFALQHKMPVLQPPTLKDTQIVKTLKNFDADVFVVIAYGQFLPKEILSLPKVFCINVHGSLLPKYRGAAPINWAIIKGETTTGISIIKMNEAMDAGDILTQEKIKIDATDTSVTLRVHMKIASAKLLLKSLETIENKTYKLVQQNEKEVTLAPKLKKEDGLINWNRSAQEIHNLVRGLLPWPVAFTRYSGKALKILETKVLSKSIKQFVPGQVINISKDAIEIATGKNILEVFKVHLESSKPMDIKSFMTGHKIGVGFRFE